MMFSFSKIKRLYSLQAELRANIKELILQKIKDLISNSPLVGIGLNGDELVTAFEKGELEQSLKDKAVAAVSGRVRKVLANTPLGIFLCAFVRLSSSLFSFRSFFFFALSLLVRKCCLRNGCFC
jgi:hypothetical protein